MTPAEYRIECEVAAACRDDLARRIAAAMHGQEPGGVADPDEEGLA